MEPQRRVERRVSNQTDRAGTHAPVPRRTGTDWTKIEAYNGRNTR
jgi:hypothetical protein